MTLYFSPFLFYLTSSLHDDAKQINCRRKGLLFASLSVLFFDFVSTVNNWFKPIVYFTVTITWLPGSLPGWG